MSLWHPTKPAYPIADNAYDLGSSTLRWRGLYLAGAANVGSLQIGGTEVISNGRVLANVTADVEIITSGRFPMARMPDGESGKVLRGQGLGVDPAYADIMTLSLSKTSQNVSVGSGTSVTVTVNPPAVKSIFLAIIEGYMPATNNATSCVDVGLSQIWVEDATSFEQTMDNRMVSSDKAIDLYGGWIGFYYDADNYSRAKVTFANQGASAVTATVTVRFLRVI